MKPLEVVVRGLTRALVQEGSQWPALCAATIAARGQLGLDVVAFARLLRIPVHAADDLERGSCPPGLAPPRLADVVPEIDWAALGVPVRERPPPTEPAGRHPAGHRPGRIVLSFSG